jgi:hypothetical protein
MGSGSARLRTSVGVVAEEMGNAVLTPRQVAAVSLGVAAAIALAFLTGRYTAPVETKTTIETVYSVREVKTRIVDRVVDTRWRRVVVTKPDGSSVTSESGESHEVERTDETNTKQENGTSKEASVTTHPYRPNWSVAGFVGLNTQNGLNVSSPTFGVMLGRRLLGPTWVHLYVESNRTVGVGLGLEF